MCVTRLVRFAGASSSLGGFGCRGEALLPDFLGRTVVILDFVGRFRDFVADTVPWWRNVASVWDPGFCGDLVCGFGGVVGKSGFSERFVGRVDRYGCVCVGVGGGGCGGVGCGLGVVRRAACLVVGPVVIDGCASLFNCTTAVRASDNDGLFVKLKPVGWGLTMSLAWPVIVQLLVFIYSGIQWSWPCVLVFAYHCDWFDFYVFALLHWLSSGLLCVSVLGVSSGPGLRFAGCGVLYPPPPLHTPGGLFC